MRFDSIELSSAAPSAGGGGTTSVGGASSGGLNLTASFLSRGDSRGDGKESIRGPPGVAGSSIASAASMIGGVSGAAAAATSAGASTYSPGQTGLGTLAAPGSIAGGSPSGGQRPWRCCRPC